MKKVIFCISVFLAILLLAHSELSPLWFWSWYAEKINSFSLAHPMAMGRIYFFLIINALCLGAYSGSASETKIPT